MALFHFNLKVLSLGRQSACASAAYITAGKIVSDFDGKIHDYSRKKEVDLVDVLLPENAPETFRNIEFLTNEMERGKSINSKIARTVEFALPVELSKEENIELARKYIKEAFVDEGMCAVVAFHKLESHNPHCHVLLTMTPIGIDGKFENRNYKYYICEKNGVIRKFTADELKNFEGWEKRYNYELPDGTREWRTKSYVEEHRDEGYVQVNRYPQSVKGSNPKVLEWDDRGNAEKWRNGWAEAQNNYFKEHGMNCRVDSRSYKRQGIDKIPGVHEGPFVSHVERRYKRDYERKIRKGYKPKVVHTETRWLNLGIKAQNRARHYEYEINRLRKSLDSISTDVYRRRTAAEEMAKELEKLRLFLIALLILIIKKTILRDSLRERIKNNSDSFSFVDSEIKLKLSESNKDLETEDKKVKSEIDALKEEYKKTEDEYVQLADSVTNPEFINEKRAKIREELEKENPYSLLESDYRKEARRFDEKHGCSFREIKTEKLLYGQLKI